MTGYKTSQAATNLNKKASFHQPHGSELEKNYREHIPVVNISMKKVMRCLQVVKPQRDLHHHQAVY